MVHGVTNTTKVTFVAVTGTEELGDLLEEGERENSKGKPILRADEQRRIGRAGGREVKESEL